MGKQIGNVNTENAFLVRARSDIVEPRFLDLALENTINQGGLERKQRGTQQQFINKDDLEDLELEVNPELMGMVVRPTVDEVAEVSTARGKLLRKGDIIVSNRGTVGRTEFIEEEIQARDGFRGNIKKPTKFKVGEAGVEFIDIMPLDLEDVIADRRIGQSEFMQKQLRKNISAKNGFMGTLNFSTMFTVGEGNKKEHVTRKKSRKKSNNIFDVESFFG